MRSSLLSLVVAGILCGCGGGGEPSAPQLAVCEALSESQRIVNGSQCATESGSVAKVVILDEEENTLLCSGVVLKPRTVLTAAHCFLNFVTEVSVEVAGVTYRAIDLKLHPLLREEGDTLFFDLALLTLDSEIPGLTAALSERAPEVGETISVFGFGSDGSTQSAGVLRGGRMAVSQVDAFFVSAQFSGAGNPGEDSNTCVGDSGGPAFLENEGRLHLVGITAFGRKSDCGPGDVSSFVNVTSPEVRLFLE